MNLLKSLPLTETKLKVLLEIYGEREDYLRNIERKTKINPSLLFRVLGDLTEAGAVDKIKKGKEIFYSLTEEGEELFGGLLEKFYLDMVLERSEELKTLVKLVLNNKEIRTGSKKIYLFGSFVSGGKTKKSDIDILFVSGKRREIIRWCREASLIIGREINPLIYTPGEFNSELRKKEPMLTSIVKNIKNRVMVK